MADVDDTIEVFRNDWKALLNENERLCLALEQIQARALRVKDPALEEIVLIADKALASTRKGVST